MPTKEQYARPKTLKPLIETFRVALVGKGQLFGEEDVIKEFEGPARKYTASVKCISNKGDIFCIKYDEFLRKFKINRESWSAIVSTAEDKEKAINERYLTIIAQIKEMQATGKKINHKQINEMNQLASPKRRASPSPLR